MKAVSSFANGMPCKIDCKTGNLMEKLKASKKMCDIAYESKYDFDEELGDRITSPLMVWLDKWSWCIGNRIADSINGLVKMYYVKATLPTHLRKTLGNDEIEDDMDINKHCKRPPITKEATKQITNQQGNWFQIVFSVLILFHVAHSKIYMLLFNSNFFV